MIRLEGVERSYQVGGEWVHALRHVDLQLVRGDYLSIMGPSGSGKSTLLHVIGLLDRPEQGRYTLDGQDTAGLNDGDRAALRRHKIGFVFQSFHLIPRLTAADNIALPMVLAGVDPAERRQRVATLLTQLDLAERAQHRPDQLSGGQQQRVAIARALVMQPSVLLADEPTGNLDRRSGTEVVERLEQLNGQGITLLVVTHDPAIGERARRSIQMVDGRIEATR